MWIAEGDRGDLIEILGGASPAVLRRGTSISTLAEAAGRIGGTSTRMSFVWAETPVSGEAPALMLVGGRHMEEFFAWTSTYAPYHLPITSYIRVLDEKWIDDLSTPPERIGFGPVSGAACGLVLVESLLRGQPSKGMQSVGSMSYLGTLSFSLGRGLVSGLTERGLERVAAGWSKVREIVHLQRDVVESEELDPWRVLVELSSVMRGRGESMDLGRAADACRRFVGARDAPSRSLFSSSGDWEELHRVVAGATNTMEMRVAAVEKGLERVLRDEPTVAARGAFELGLAMAALSPGSLDYVGLVPWRGRVPAMVLRWYAFCAGWAADREIMNTNGGLGRRVIRDLSAPERLLDTPRADVSVDELSVLRPSRTSRPSVPVLDSLPYWRVEIGPGVVTMVRRGEQGGEQQPPSVQVPGAVVERSVSRDLQEIIDRLMSVSVRLDEEEQAGREHRGKRRRRQ